MLNFSLSFVCCLLQNPKDRLSRRQNLVTMPDLGHSSPGSAFLLLLLLFCLFVDIHRSGLPTAMFVTWLVPRETAAISAHVQYNNSAVYCVTLFDSNMYRVRVCLAVACHLHLRQNGRDVLRATAVTQGWNGYRNKSRES